MQIYREFSKCYKSMCSGEYIENKYPITKESLKVKNVSNLYIYIYLF